MRDFADRALMRRGRHGALVSRLPATGSTIAGGSHLHRTGRKRLNLAIRDNVPLLVRESDGVVMRAATFDECIEALKNGTGRIRANVTGADPDEEVVWCIVRRANTTKNVEPPKFDPTPRLVKTKKGR